MAEPGREPSTPETPTPEPGGMAPGRKLMVAIVAAAVVVAVVFLVVRSTSSGGGSSTTTTQPLPQLTSTTLLTGPAAELRDLLAKGDAIDRHAVYTASDPEGTTRMEVWHKNGRARYDTHVTAADGSTSDTVFIHLSDHSVQCARKGNDPYVCSAVAVTDANPFTFITADLSGKQVITTDDTIDGRAVKCYGTSNPEGQPASLCVTPDGIPVRLSSSSSNLTLASLDNDTSGASFDPPATPGATPANNFSTSS